MNSPTSRVLHHSDEGQEGEQVSSSAAARKLGEPWWIYMTMREEGGEDMRKRMNDARQWVESGPMSV